MGTVAPEPRTIPTCEDESELSLLFSVRIIINTLTEYISIIY